MVAANNPEDGKRWRRWKKNWEQASFAGARFFVEADSRASGRRVAVHQYPKRNEPYSEDMGRAAIRIHVNGYLIGHPGIEDDGSGLARGELDYLQMKDELIFVLEKDGPDILRLPMQYQKRDIMVMVVGYSVSESRERGGMCTVEMDFVEYGNPTLRQFVNTSSAIMGSAAAAEQMVVPKPTADTAKEVEPFAEIHTGADIGSA